MYTNCQNMSSEKMNGESSMPNTLMLDENAPKDTSETLPKVDEFCWSSDDYLVPKDYRAMLESARSLSELQNSRMYKIYVALLRFQKQVLQTNQGREYLKWVANALLNTKYTVPRLREFDPVLEVRLRLQKQVQLHEFFDKRFFNAVPRKYQKKGRQVFILAGVPVYDVGGGQRCSQLANTFNKLGFRVHYIYAFPCAESAPSNIYIPAVSHFCIDEVSDEWFSALTKDGDLVIIETPFAGFQKFLSIAKEKNCYVIYEHIDNWDTSLGSLFYDETVFSNIIGEADLITVTAKKLGEKIEKFTQNSYIYLPNAVNSELFDPQKEYDCPPDLKKGKRTLVYFGSLWGEWFDWSKIEYVANHCPGASINLIGDCAGCQNQRRKMPANVHFLGLKEQKLLPAYLKHSDIALLPFKNCDIGRYVSPLKVFEYIAMQICVLSTCLEDIQHYPNVFCLDTEEEWAEMVNGSLPNMEDVSEFVTNNNWYARCEQMLIRANCVRTIYPKISIIVLNRNNMNVIFRCISTLLSCQTRYGYEVIVVDNESSDGSPEKLEKVYGSRIKLLRNGKNGCSSGRNLGALYAEGEYLCFLDSDQWVVSNRWLDNELDILESDAGIGAVGWTAGWFLPGKVDGPTVDYYANRAIQNPAQLYRDDVAYLGSGGLMLRKVLFDSVGGFDEFYDPTCYEDTDISLKIRDCGYELAYTPNSAIMHLPHQTTKSGTTQHAKLMKRNSDYFEKKWKERNPELLEYYYHELG